MPDTLHGMIEEVYEISMVYVIPVIINLAGGYLIAEFAAQFGEMRWKFKGGRLLFAFFYMLQYELISTPRIGHTAGLHLLWLRLVFYIRMLVMLKIFFVIRRDKLLFVTVMYAFLGSVLTLIVGMLGNFHPEMLALQLAGKISHNGETAHLLTMLFSIGAGVLQEAVKLTIRAFGIRLIAGELRTKKHRFTLKNCVFC